MLGGQSAGARPAEPVRGVRLRLFRRRHRPPRRNDDDPGGGP